jgi:hypothetical protein
MHTHTKINAFLTPQVYMEFSSAAMKKWMARVRTTVQEDIFYTRFPALMQKMGNHLPIIPYRCTFAISPCQTRFSLPRYGTPGKNNQTA